MYRRLGKRLIDLAGAVVGLAVGSIPMLIVALLIRREMGSPLLYRAIRPGLNAKPFELMKFRTMANINDASGRPLPDKDRVTPLGRLLRRTSLDELPQLINVLKGEMSLVGPRPLKIEYLPLYTTFQARRHEVVPGITGLAQIKGRNQLTWEQKFELDVNYVDNVSFGLDMRILLQTIFKVIRRESVGRDGDVEVPLFTGSSNTTDRGMASVADSSMDSVLDQKS